MAKILIVLFVLLSPTAFTTTAAAPAAAAPAVPPPANVPDQLLGTYTGCGISTAFGPKQAVFHLVELPSDLNGGVQVTGSLTWYGGPNAIYFPQVQINGRRLYMRTEIKPQHDFGLIINTLTITLNRDGSINGDYRTNSMVPDGRLFSATFTARKSGHGMIQRLDCR